MNKKRNILLICIILITGLISCLIVNRNFYHQQEELLLKANSYIVQEILKISPELEEDLMKITIASYNQDLSKLEEYGVTLETLKYLTKDNSLKKDMIISNSLILIITVLLIFAIIIINKRKDEQKIIEIEKYITEILNDNYSLDIRDYTETHLSHLKNYIYKMTVKLKEAKDLSHKDKLYLEETLQDISHQLKTPLTSMYITNELLEKDLTKEKRQELLTKNYEQLNRIEWLVTSLLKLSMLDSGTIKLNIKKNSCKDVVTSAIKSLEIPIELKGLDLNIDIKENITAKFDFNWTSEAILNIVKNAYEHTVEGGIYITAEKNPIYTEIKIRDTGNGISKDDIRHIFERFYRSNSNTKESIGIGLNMSKKIIDLQKGDIFVESTKAGTTFSIRFYNK